MQPADRKSYDKQLTYLLSLRSPGLCLWKCFWMRHLDCLL